VTSNQRKNDVSNLCARCGRSAGFPTSPTQIYVPIKYIRINFAVFPHAVLSRCYMQLAHINLDVAEAMDGGGIMQNISLLIIHRCFSPHPIENIAAQFFY
jgi:hypothetical protein